MPKRKATSGNKQITIASGPYATRSGAVPQPARSQACIPQPVSEISRFARYRSKHAKKSERANKAPSNLSDAIAERQETAWMQTRVKELRRHIDANTGEF